MIVAHCRLRAAAEKPLRVTVRGPAIARRPTTNAAHRAITGFAGVRERAPGGVLMSKKKTRTSLKASNEQQASSIDAEVVDTNGAAKIIGLAPATLITLRSRNEGKDSPPFLKVGPGRRRVVYRIADLRRWRDERSIRGGAS
jgi:hypothetical protein